MGNSFFFPLGKTLPKIYFIFFLVMLGLVSFLESIVSNIASSSSSAMMIVSEKKKEKGKGKRINPSFDRNKKPTFYFNNNVINTRT
jgi:hypothetical protein